MSNDASAVIVTAIHGNYECQTSLRAIAAHLALMQAHHHAALADITLVLDLAALDVSMIPHDKTVRVWVSDMSAGWYCARHTIGANLQSWVVALHRPDRLIN